MVQFRTDVKVPQPWGKRIAVISVIGLAAITIALVATWQTGGLSGHGTRGGAKSSTDGSTATTDTTTPTTGNTASTTATVTTTTTDTQSTNTNTLHVDGVNNKDDSSGTCQMATMYTVPTLPKPTYSFGNSACCDACPTASIVSGSCTGSSPTYQIQCCKSGETECSGDVIAASDSSSQSVIGSPCGTLDGSVILACSPDSPVSETGTTPAPAGTAPPTNTIEPVAPVYEGIQPAFGPSRRLIWSDEFDGTSVNWDIWEPTVGNGCWQNCGFGNEELQSYQKENAYIDDGWLVLEAKSQYIKDEYNNINTVSSAKISTKVDGPNNILYGRVEVKASLPSGQGGWPSIFFLPADWAYGNWPASGEIDLLESFNTADFDAKKIMGSTHFGYESWAIPGVEGSGAKGQNACVLIDGSSYAGPTPHLFTLEWTPQSIKFYVDQLKYCEVTRWFTGKALDSPTAPFDKPFIMIFNLAFGGVLPNLFTAPDNVSQKMSFDYVRVFDLTDEERAWQRPTGVQQVTPVDPHVQDFALCKTAANPWQIISGSMRLDTEFFDCGTTNGDSYFDLDPTINKGNGVLRATTGVEIWEDEFWLPLSVYKFVDAAGLYVEYEPTEWTKYSVNMAISMPQIYFEIRHNNLMDGGAPFRILIDSKNCNTNDPRYLLVDGIMKESQLPVVLPPASMNINMRCWQTERWASDTTYWNNANPMQGAHYLTFCALGNLAVQYMDIFSFQPWWTLNAGPGCNFPKTGP